MMPTNQLLAECEAWKKRALEAEKELKEVRRIYRNISEVLTNILSHVENLMDKFQTTTRKRKTAKKG